MRVTVLLAAALFARGARIVTDDGLQFRALSAIFPGMSIVPVRGKRIDSSLRLKEKTGELTFPDALKDEPVYHVVGAPSDATDLCAAKTASDGSVSGTRELRLRLFSVSQTRYVAVLQYNFPEASPAMACQSVARLVLLDQQAQRFAILDQFTFDTGHHNAIEQARFVALRRDGSEQLVVESDSGGAAASGASLFIFDASGQKFVKLFETPSRSAFFVEDDNLSQQVLDVPRTLADQGGRFCFTKTTWAEKDHWFDPPRITHPCYSREK